MTNIQELRQAVQAQVQCGFDEGAYIDKQLVTEAAIEAFEDMGGAEAFDIDEDEVQDFIVDEIISGLTIQL